MKREFKVRWKKKREMGKMRVHMVVESRIAHIVTEHHRGKAAKQGSEEQLLV